MPDLLKKVVTLYAPDGSIEREYKTVLFEGEGAPRDVEITVEDRLAIYNTAHAVSTALVSDLRSQVGALQEQLGAALAKIAALTPGDPAP